MDILKPIQDQDFSTLKPSVEFVIIVIRRVFRLLWALYQAFLGIMLILIILGLLKVLAYFEHSNIRSLQHNNPHTTAFIQMEKVRLGSAGAALAQSGRKSRGLPNSISWQWEVWDSIPILIKELVIIAEDGKFYHHNGFDLEQLEYAIVSNHQAGKKGRGASTISQQVVKNLYLTNERSYSRKIREAGMAVLLEHYLGKERILEIYLNIAQFAPGVFGVKAAAQYYFKKPLSQLKYHQTVSLLALLPAPNKWTPWCQDLAYQKHRIRIMGNLRLYKDLYRKIPDDTYKRFLEYAKTDEENRWKHLRDRELRVLFNLDSATMQRDTLPVVNP